MKFNIHQITPPKAISAIFRIDFEQLEIIFSVAILLNISYHAS
jgi:hypothetical protein